MSKISLMMFLFITFHCIPNDFGPHCTASMKQRVTFFFLRGRRALHFGEGEEEDRKGQRSRCLKPMLPGRDCGRSTAGTSTGTSFATIVEERLHILILKIDFWVALIINMDGKDIYACIYIYMDIRAHTRIYIYCMYIENTYSLFHVYHAYIYMHVYKHIGIEISCLIDSCQSVLCSDVSGSMQESTTVASQVLVGRGMTIPEGNI